MSDQQKKVVEGINRKLKQMKDKAVRDLKKLKVPPEVIRHNTYLFHVLGTSLKEVNEKEKCADVDPYDILWLSLYNNLSYGRLPSEIKESIGDLFRRYIELKKVDMSQKKVWSPYKDLVDECPVLALFRTFDLAYFPTDYDILVNFFSFEKKKVEHQVRNIAESMLYVYSPFADIMGIHNVHTLLREKSTSILYPSLYNEVKARVDNLQRENEYVLENFRNRLEYDIIEAELDGGIHFSWFKESTLIRGRIKTAGSILLKLLREDYPVEKMMEFEDLVAFTVLTETIEDAYKFVDFLSSKYDISGDHIEDYIASPRGATQYQSIHVGVPFEVVRDGVKIVRRIEVQIRTPEMQERCERGDLAHACYKQRKIDKERILLMAKYANILRNARTEDVQLFAFGLREERIPVYVTMISNGVVQKVDVPQNACVYDLICKVSDPFRLHRVFSISTNRPYSLYERLTPRMGYFIECTDEELSLAEIKKILQVCSVETRMQLQWILENKK